MKPESRYRCPCCGYYMLVGRGEYNSYPVCYWEDDDPLDTYGNLAGNRSLGANTVSLAQARRNFGRYGAIAERFKKHVRAPLLEEVPPTRLLDTV